MRDCDDNDFDDKDFDCDDCDAPPVQMPGWTCPDIDACKRSIRRIFASGDPLTVRDRDGLFVRLESLRQSNAALRDAWCQLMLETAC